MKEFIANIRTILAALIGIVFIAVLIIVFAGAFRGGSYWKTVSSVPHPKVVLGLPSAAMLALFLILCLEQKDKGDIRFKIIGIELESVAGEVVLWIALFTTIAVVMSFLW
jgi:hypothetical protein